MDLLVHLMWAGQILQFFPSIKKSMLFIFSLPAIRTTKLTVHRATYFNVIKTIGETDLLCIFAHIFLFGLLRVHYVQKLSGT